MSPVPAVTRLRSLVLLLDDDTPEVRESLAVELDTFRGDVSELLEETGCRPSPEEARILSELLLPARRDRLRSDWTSPAGGAITLWDDWEGFEASLRLLSDYLHDGVTLRPPLGDALDLLAEELAPIADRKGPAAFCHSLFSEQRLLRDPHQDLDPSHFELAMALQGAPSNPLALGIIILLLAGRLSLDVTGVNLPGAFFCRCMTDSGPVIIDPGAGGRIVPLEDFTHQIRNHPKEIRLAAARATTPGELLLRTVEDLATAYSVLGQVEDAELMEDIIASLTESR